MTKPIWLALAAFFFYGFGGPLMKASHQAGISPRDFVFVSSFITVTMAIFWVNGETAILSGNITSVKGLWTTIPAAVLLGLGFITLNRALAEPLGLASVVLVIASANPLISSSLSMIFLDEAKRVHLLMLIPGALLIVAGIIFVSFSVKSH